MRALGPFGGAAPGLLARGQGGVGQVRPGPSQSPATNTPSKPASRDARPPGQAAGLGDRKGADAHHAVPVAGLLGGVGVDAGQPGVVLQLVPESAAGRSSAAPR